MEGVDPKQIAAGGDIDEGENYFSPTIVKDIDKSSKLMQDEIFGPILPILAVDSFDDALEYVNSRPHPLTLYVFTKNNKLKQKIIDGTQSGSAVVNDTLVQFAQSTLPFGGVGDSGMGAYHGKKSFDTFSHARSVLDKSVWFDLDMRYPPYSDSKLNKAKLLM